MAQKRSSAKETEGRSLARITTSLKGSEEDVDGLIDIQQVERPEDQGRHVRLRTEKTYNNNALSGHMIEAIGRYAMVDNPNIAVVLAGVCRHWRESIYAYKALWRHLVLGSKASLDKVVLWFQRSGDCITTLEVSESFDHRRDDSILPSLEIFLGEVRHFKYFNAADIQPEWWIDVFSRLESLVIHPVRKVPGRGFDWSFFKDARNLRHVDICDLRLAENMEPGPCTVTTVILSRIVSASPLIDMTPELEFLHLEDVEFEYAEWADLIELPKLRHFRQSCEGRDEVPILQALVMPALRVLDLFDYRKDVDIALSYQAFAYNQLTFLDLGRSDIEDHWLVPILPELHQIRFLGLSYTMTGHQVIYRLTHRSRVKEKRICPHLVALSLSWVSTHGFALSKLVNSRLPVHERLSPQDFLGTDWSPEKIASFIVVADDDDGDKSAGAGEKLADDDYSEARIDWLCIDGCDVDEDFIPILSRKVATVLADPNGYDVNRMRGKGEYQWDSTVQGDCAWSLCS